MSLANRPTTHEEQAFLESHGWRGSCLESLGEYRGNWTHPDVIDANHAHYGPDEALELTRKLGLNRPGR